MKALFLITLLIAMIFSLTTIANAETLACAYRAEGIAPLLRCKANYQSGESNYLRDHYNEILLCSDHEKINGQKLNSDGIRGPLGIAQESTVGSAAAYSFGSVILLAVDLGQTQKNGRLTLLDQSLTLDCSR